MILRQGLNLGLSFCFSVTSAQSFSLIDLAIALPSSFVATIVVEEKSLFCCKRFEKDKDSTTEAGAKTEAKLLRRLLTGKQSLYIEWA
jgi:hypothetical protein